LSRHVVQFAAVCAIVLGDLHRRVHAGSDDREVSVTGAEDDQGRDHDDVATVSVHKPENRRMQELTLRTQQVVR
jgi:hypothetical protein